MPIRDITVTLDINERVGDETFELWLKAGDGEWALEETGAVPDAATQSFTMLGLEEGVPHVAQVRMVREGRYRSDYFSTNPDLWPAQSRMEFTPGETDFAAPALSTAVWSRTSGSSQRVTVECTANAAHEDLAIQLLRDGVVVAEVAGPHSGTVTLVDLDPPIAAAHDYTLRHRDGFLVGQQSAPVEVWSGPIAPAGFVDTTVPDFYNFSLGWDAPASGAVTRVQDDYAAQGEFADRAVTAADATTYSTTGLEKNSAMASNGNINAYFEARIRHEVTAFSVTDVSAWSEPVAITTEVAPDETAWDSRPAPE